MKHISIFASGKGTNAENVIRYFQNSNIAKVVLVLSNNAEAPVIEKSKKLRIPVFVFNKEEFTKTDQIILALKKANTDLILLAGFLWLIPPQLIDAFPDRIINVHPSLLPRHGGKGMFGKKVHEQVLQSGDQESGISIHLVNSRFDEGKLIMQKSCRVLADDTPETLALRVQQLEHENLPSCIENLLKGKDF